MSDHYLSEAEALLVAGDPAAAERVLETAWRGDQATVELGCVLGQLQYHQGRKHRATATFLQAVARDPAAAAPYRQLGDLFAAEGDWERAEGYYSLAVGAASDDLESLRALTELYQQAGLFYSARRIARRALHVSPQEDDLRRLLGELDAVLPDRSVTVYVPCYNAAATIGSVLEALLAQSYPIAELLVIDDGSTDDSVQRAAEYPIRILTHGDNRGLSAARNTALLASQSDYLAHVDSDVIADSHWLERLMLFVESERMNQEAGDAPLGGIMGRLDELHDVELADQWRTIHMGQHHGDEPSADVPHLYGCNSLWLREALFSAGGHDEKYRTNGEDCDASDRVRAKGYRLAYDPQARCRHLRRDTLASVMKTIWRYHTPYYEHRFGLFATGEVSDVLKKLPENLSRYAEDCRLDQERRTFHLRYPTFLGLPWRILSDLQLAAEQAPEDRRQVIAETQAGVYLGLFTLLHEADGREDLLAMIQEDLAPCRPADAALAELCGPAGVAAVIASLTGAAGNPMHRLPRREVDAVSQVLRAVAEVWGQFEDLDWDMIRASAYRLRTETTRRENAQASPRVALVNAPWVVDGRIGVRAGSRWPFTQDAHGQRIPAYVPFPFFLATAAAMLVADGVEIQLTDAIAEGLLAEEFLKRLEGYQPDIVLMELATASHEIDLDWCLRYKERLGDGVQVYVCGPHATALGAALMEEAPQIDGIVLGEYEPIFRRVVAVLRAGGDLGEIQGLIWRDADGAVRVQQERPALPPMSEYPWPERETLPMYNYFDSFADAMPWPNVQMHASRGCPFQCIFCVWPQVVYDGPTYRTRDNGDIVAEMGWVVDRYGFRAVYFDDDTFNIQNDRIIDLCDTISAADLGVPICAMGRADTSNRAAFEAMKRAGVVGLKFGVETGDPEMMKRIKKHLDLAKVEQAVEWCQELGIGVHLTFSFGGPEETWETAQRTIDLALRLDPDTVQFSLMTPFPGTEMFVEAKAKGHLLTEDWTQYDGARYSIVKGEHLSRDELEEVILTAHRQWLMHLTKRAIRDELGADDAAEQGCAARAEELAGLPDRGALQIELTTPLDGLDESLVPPAMQCVPLDEPARRSEVVDGILSLCYQKLQPGGLLICHRGSESLLPEGWCDQRLAEWALYNGMESLAAMQGFNGELALVWRRTREHDSYDEVAAFTGEDRATVYAKCRHGNWWTADAWYTVGPATPQERERFYRRSDCYLYELTHWEVNDRGPRWQLAGEAQGGRLLDFGCGIGTVVLCAAEQGIEVHGYDVSQRQLEYLRWRLDQFHADVKDRVTVIERPEDLEQYELVTCLHVLEHVEQPLAVMRQVYGCVKPGGRLLLVAPFKEELSEMHPLHLKEHAHLTLDGLVAAVGGEVLGWTKYDGVYDMCVARKPAEVPAESVR